MIKFNFWVPKNLFYAKTNIKKTKKYGRFVDF